MVKFLLGLDLGTNSIGWAIVKLNDDSQPIDIVSCGVRIFQEVTDAKTSTPKNQLRRQARALRRLYSRRRLRRDSLLNILVKKGLLPSSDSEREKLFSDLKNYDPYQLRKKALDYKLELYELGRIFYHLCKRRGFQSNRKAKSKEEGIVKTSIASLREKIKNERFRTLGEYLAGQPKKRSLYTDRNMYMEEFEKIWNKQQEFYSNFLVNELKVKIHKTIFFQRPLKLQKGLVGKCTFERTRKRAFKALLDSQKFRYLQAVNNLVLTSHVTGEVRSLTAEERNKLVEVLDKCDKMNWDAVRKTLSMRENEVFNFEESGRKHLIGNTTNYTLGKVLGDKWYDMPLDKKRALVIDILTIENTKGFIRRMVEHWKFDEETAIKLTETELEPGYMSLSNKAISKILPFLEKGLTYDKACQSAGYEHNNLNRHLNLDKLPEPPKLPNPVVQKVLYETRKLVNAVIRTHGKPELIRIEMARDLKLSKKKKELLQKKQKEREKANVAAKEKIRKDFGIQNPTKEDIQKYLLWEECKMTCPYTGTPISKEMLFSSDVEIEHILPYSLSLDDSYMNKTLCMASENRVKNNRTPYETYSADKEKYEQILQRVKDLPYQKRRRFEQKEVDTEQYITRQLNDTRYICTEIKKYLQQLCSTIEVSKGEATALLRYKWGLNKILSSNANQKNREDHRHHAIDAIVIAFTSRSLLQKISMLSAKSGGTGPYKLKISPPLKMTSEKFYNQVKTLVESIIVSHAPSRKISGALHEETAYGRGGQKDTYVYRVPLTQITPAMIEKIRDAKVKELVKKRVEECEGDLKRAFNNSNPLLHKDGKTPIKSVRIETKIGNVWPIQRNGTPYKFFKLGNNHHVEILENLETGEREGKFVTTMEATKRAKILKTDIVQRDHGENFKFIMSLAINDMVEVEEDGVKKYYRVQKMSDPSIIFRLHNVTATKDTDNSGILRKTAGTFNGQKIKINILGKIMCYSYD
ncbi:MAG: type II CRISPR RNA-guided endonuclease Cas9 [bacterium]